MENYDYSGEEDSQWDTSTSITKKNQHIEQSDCYGDFYNEYVKLMKEIYPVVPEAFIKGSAIFLIASVIGKNIKCGTLNIGGKKKAHVLVMFLGPSTGAHKSTMIEVVNDILMKLEDTVHIHAGRFSSEQMFSDLSKYSTGVIIKDEFTTVFDESSKKHSSDIKAFLTHLFDGWLEDRSTRVRGLETARDVSVSMLCATVPSLLSSKLETTDFSGGFLPRFLFFVSKDNSKFMPIRRITPIESNKLSKVVRTLKYMHSKFEVGNIDTYFTDSALALMSEWMEGNSSCDSTKTNIVTTEMKPFYRRLVDYVIKLCIIFKVSSSSSNYDTNTSNGEKTILINDAIMQRAINFVEEYKKEMLPLVATLLHDTDISRVYNRIKDMCEGKENKSVSKSELLRSLGVLSNKLDMILDTLEMSEMIEIEHANNVVNGVMRKKKYIIKLTGKYDY